MSEILVMGGLVILGLYAINQIFAKIPEIKTAGQLEQEYTESLGVGNVGKMVEKEVSYYDPVTKSIKTEKRMVSAGLYSPCASDINCEANSLIGAKTRCLGNVCTPLVKKDKGDALWNADDLNIKKICGRRFLMGVGSPCQYDSQCSTSGLTCDVFDTTSCQSAIDKSDTYCNSKGRCQIKPSDSVGIKWKIEDMPNPEAVEQLVNTMMAPRLLENNISIDVLSRNNNCKELTGFKQNIKTL